jgi:hypothetical protein
MGKEFGINAKLGKAEQACIAEEGFPPPHFLSLSHNPCVFLLLVSDMKKAHFSFDRPFFCLRMGITIILYFTSLMIGECADYRIERFRGLGCPVIFTPNNFMGCCNLTSAVL